MVSAEHGKIRCWGEGELGELGYGPRKYIGSSASTVPSLAGDVVVPGREVVQISTGWYHTCALLDNGAVRCWGYGFFGQLGYGDNISRSEPGADDVIVSSTNRVVQISAGGFHTCALLDNGRVRCWGLDDNGQLGYGKNDYLFERHVLLPSSVGDVNVSSDHSVVQISAGRDHTCALLADGNVRCWGDGSGGCLGYGSTGNVGDRPSTVPSIVGDVLVSTSYRVVQISAGTGHTCAVLSNGGVRCWGYGGSGRLGYGNTANVGDVPTALPSMVGDVNVSSTAAVIQVTCGFAHTCALLDNGKVRCWGDGDYGKLGYGNLQNVGDSIATLPSFSGDVSVASEKVVQVQAGGLHTCALLESGKVRCWGFGLFGQLGYGARSYVGDSVATLPSTAGDVSVGWDVSIECEPLGLTTTPTSPQPTAASSPSHSSLPAQEIPRNTTAFHWVIVVAVAIAILCFAVLFGVGVVLYARRRRRTSALPLEHDGVTVRPVEIHSESRSREARRVGRRRGTDAELGGALANPFQDSGRVGGGNVYSTAQVFHVGKPAVDVRRYDALHARNSSRGYISATAPRTSRSGAVASLARTSGRKDTAYESPSTVLRGAGGYETAQVAVPRGGGRYESASVALRGGTARL